ncbi:MAG: GxxExxY protein [Planctomycetota bacterium]
MNADERRLNPVIPMDQLTERVIGCAFAVSNTLGSGFLEKVYENALRLEIMDTGLQVAQQHSIKVAYRGQVVGEYVADLLVDRRLIVEIKAAKAIDPVHVAQCINYLKATNHNIGLLLNFGKPKLEIRRLVHQFKQPN